MLRPSERILEDAFRVVLTCRGVNALAEAVNGLFKTELIRGPEQGPWRSVDDVELATLSWVHWHNTVRLHGYCGDVPPAEFEANWAKANRCASAGSQQSDATDLGGTNHRSLQTPGVS